MHAKQILSAVAVLIATARAHVTLSSPTPFGKPDSSPLSPAGTDFPCKSNNGFSASTSTKMVSGQSQTVSFSGVAVHNGGSCQLSLTKDKAPTAASKFKVIYSIMGGCPGVDGATTSYQFKVPEEVPNGDYTFSWSWMNNLGNREFYQNCAPVSVSGSSTSDDSAFNALPDMAVYNIKSVNQCSTAETKDVKFPNPGKYVQISPNAKLADPVGSGCGSSNAAAASPAASSPSSGSGSGNSGMYGAGSGAGSGSGSGAGTGAGSSSSASPVSSAAPSSSGGTFAEGAGSGSSGSNSSGSSSSGSSSSGSSSSGSSSSGSSSSGSSTSAPAAAAPTDSTNSTAAAPAAPATPAGATTCSINGAVVCSTDGNSFGLCNWGLVAYQPVASGTKCLNGSIMRRWTWKA